MLIDQRLATLTIAEGEEIIRSLHTAAAELCNAIEGDVNARRMLKEAEADLSAVESEIVTEATIQAIGKEGPLAGIATTSKAYAAATEVLLGKSPRLHSIRKSVHAVQTDADNASIAVQQAQMRFAATKHAADLKAAIIRAIAL